MLSKNTLYIVATPIGNPRDITLRALDVLQDVDAVICEDYRQGERMLKKIGITGKTMIELNEHNEKSTAPEIVQKLLLGQVFALISDDGTPVFADPGAGLINQAHQSGIHVIPVPGPSSLMAAISLLDFKMTQFIYAGFLPQRTKEREISLQKLKTFQMPIVLMDTPYRLGKLLSEVRTVFGTKQQLTLACDLTLTNEAVFRGSVASVQKQAGNRKAEFILILHGRKG
jgi:16S rRNA (cytidine1402-2'-O)-methyltransferase